MTIQQLTPFITITLNLISAVVYLVNGDIKHCIYWISAAVLTICVTI